MTTTTATLTCPSCGLAFTEEMPRDACVVRWTCPSCGQTDRPKAGDCCVFCSFANVPCPPVQEDGRCCGD